MIGLVLLSLTSWLFLVKPAGCGDGEKHCVSASSTGTMMFYLSIYMVALGYGGHQPTLATLGVDQFDESNTKYKEKGAKGAFFAYFYVALNVGSLFSNTVLVYYEDIGHWTVGFWVSMGSALVGLLSYLCGSFHYRYIKASGNPIPRIAQVFVAACRKSRVPVDDEKKLYEVDGAQSAIKGSRKILHSEQFK
ncbi:putative proton-dependent oligopeptide transporter family, MFS transporter superfamily [Helianthus annuus]|nr:putative proton-dependent oligopeptide transporter family, MFS transporter superfamily [Helianthus annuus]